MSNQSKNKKPPKFPEHLMSRMFPDDSYYTTVSDLEEDYKYLLSVKGIFLAKLWYWLQIVPALVYFLTVNIKWGFIMLKSNIKIAFRNINKNKINSCVSILSFTIGMTVFLIITLYNQYELSYDDYHENSDRIFRIALDLKNLYIQADTPDILAPTCVEAIPEVLSAVRIRRLDVRLVANENKSLLENNIYMSDSNIFDIFSFNVIHGDPGNALHGPNSIVITETMAEKYFNGINPIGKILTLNDTENYIVTAVIRDTPQNSHLRIDFLIPLTMFHNNWKASTVYTYCLLNASANPQDVENKLNNLIDKNVYPDGKRNRIYINKFILQPLPKIHLHSDLMNEIISNGRIRYIYLLSIIAFIILIIACINYINLAIVRSAAKSKEVGVRKVFGANRKQIVMQFFTESMIISLFALSLSVLIVYFVLNDVNSFVEKDMEYNIIDMKNSITIASLFFIVSIIGGIYPALYISSFRPAAILNKVFLKYGKNAFLKNILVISQFTVSIILLISVLGIKLQAHYLRNKNIGFDKEGIVVIRLRGQKAYWNYNVIKAELLKNNSIRYVSRSTELPINVYSATKMKIPGYSESEDRPLFYRIGVDNDFLNVYNLKISRGRGFSKKFPSDINNALMLNETAVKMLGWQNPVGKEYTHRQNEPVIGEIKDFHFHSLHSHIRPIYFYLTPGIGSYLSIKIDKSNINDTLGYIKTVINTFSPNYPFVYRFFDEILDSLYLGEQKLGSIFSICSFIVIFIACIGLFGLALYTVERRRKEVGIRKIVGASVSNIMLMFSKEFTKWILLANIIACPVGYFTMKKWLNTFAYRVDIGLKIFILSGLSVFCIAFFTVVYQTIKAATANPVDSLRDE